MAYFHSWAEHVGVGDCGFLNNGLLRFVTPDNVANLEANVEMLERVGVDNRVIGPADVREIAPGFNIDDVVAAAYEPRSGCADPVATVHGFLDAAAANSAELRTGVEVTGIDVQGGKAVGVQTTDGPISAGTVMIAGGAWASRCCAASGSTCHSNQVRIQVAVFKRPPALSAMHPICIDGINELWMRPEGPNWGSTLIGYGNRQALDDPDTLDEGVDGDYVPAARERLARRVPGMEQSPMRGGWAGAITATIDGKPIIDRHPEIDGLYFFTGDNGSSFKTSPAIGRTSLSGSSMERCRGLTCARSASAASPRVISSSVRTSTATVTTTRGTPTGSWSGSRPALTLTPTLSQRERERPASSPPLPRAGEGAGGPWG